MLRQLAETSAPRWLAPDTIRLTQRKWSIDLVSSAVLFLAPPILIRLNRPLGIPAHCTKAGNHEILWGLEPEITSRRKTFVTMTVVIRRLHNK
jgi:hypothetical protein